MEFPIAVASGHTLAAAARDLFVFASFVPSLRPLRLRAFDRKDRTGPAEAAKKNAPRVLVETPAPPVFGKETPAGVSLRLFCLLSRIVNDDAAYRQIRPADH